MTRPQRIDIAGKRTRIQSDRMRRWLRKWRSRLLVEHWTFEAEVLQSDHARDPDHTCAQIDVNERYADARLRIYPRLWRDGVKAQERAIVHEMIHAPLNHVGNLLDRLSMAGLATQAEVDDAYESLTEYITNVVWDAYE